MGKKIPQALLDRQELERQQTVNRILRAIEDFQAQGCRLSIKSLMDYTGFARSTFAKPHVREVLSRHGFASDSEAPEQSKKRKQSEKFREKDERIQRLTEENAALKQECELLRGRLFLLMQRQQNT